MVLLYLDYCTAENAWGGIGSDAIDAHCVLGNCRIIQKVL